MGRIDWCLDNAKGIALGLPEIDERAPPSESTEPASYHFDRLSNPRCPLGGSDAVWASEVLEVRNEPVEPVVANRGWDAEEEAFDHLHLREWRALFRQGHVAVSGENAPAPALLLIEKTELDRFVDLVIEGRSRPAHALAKVRARDLFLVADRADQLPDSGGKALGLRRKEASSARAAP